MKAVGFMQHNGVPIDMSLLDSLNTNWDAIKTQLITSVDARYGVYVEGSFKEALFESYLARESIPWPRLDSGRLALDRNTFSNMSKRYPIVQPLHELRKTLGELKLNKLAVGRDGRNRTLLSPFAAKTGRNQPSTTKFVFGPAKWIRGLIKPTDRMALAYCDWSSQEIASPLHCHVMNFYGTPMKVVIPTLLLQYRLASHHLAQPRKPTRISVTVVSQWCLAPIMA